MQSTASMSGLPVSRAMRVDNSRSSARMGPGRGLDGRADVVGARVGHHAEQVEGGGIADVAGGAGASGNPGAVDQDGGDVGHAEILGRGAVPPRWVRATRSNLPRAGPGH